MASESPFSWRWVAALTMLGPSATAIHHIPLVPHHVQKTRRSLLPSPSLRRRSTRGLQQQVDALYQGYGTHYVDLWVGTPQPQRQTVIVDTGSGVTAFPCSGCKDCGESHHTDHYFIEANSTSFVKVPCDQCTRGHCQKGDGGIDECRIGMSYQEGSSWTAYESRDITYAGGPHNRPLHEGEGTNNMDDPYHANAFAFELTFGCQYKLTGLFKTQLADGIMGMDHVDSSFWKQALDHKVMDKANFSLCFARQPTAEREGTEAGALTLGGADEHLHKTPMVYSKVKKQSGFYSVTIRNIYLREGGGGDSATSTDPNLKVVSLGLDQGVLNTGNVIVDSGTTDSYFSRRMSSAFKDHWQQMAGQAYSHDAMKLTDQELNALPTILLQLAGDDINEQQYSKPETVAGLAGTLDFKNPHDVVLAIPPSHYMEYDAEKGYIPRFYVDEGSGSVIGANSMMGHDVNFDIDNNRIGWAESKCDYTALVNEFGNFGATTTEVEKSETTEEHQSTPTNQEPVEKQKPHVDNKTPGEDVQRPISSAADMCTSIACRGGVAGALAGLVLVGMLAWRKIRSSSRPVEYQATELEVPNLALQDDDDDDFIQYRDNPSYEDDDDSGSDDDDEEAADEGVGYEDEPETGREIA